MRKFLNHFVIIKTVLTFCSVSMSCSPVFAGGDIGEKILEQLIKLTAGVDGLSSRVGTLTAVTAEEGAQIREGLSIMAKEALKVSASLDAGSLQVGNVATGIGQLVKPTMEIASAATKAAPAFPTLAHVGEEAVALAQKNIPVAEEIAREATTALGYLGVIAEFVAAHPIETGAAVIAVGVITCVLYKLTSKYFLSCDGKKNIMVRGAKAAWGKCTSCLCNKPDESLFVPNEEGECELVLNPSINFDEDQQLSSMDQEAEDDVEQGTCFPCPSIWTLGRSNPSRGQLRPSEVWAK
jgi:hypothetical protein